MYTSFQLDAVSDAIRDLNEDLWSVTRWATENSLILNADKTQAIIFSERAVSAMVPSITLNGVVVPYTSTVLNLGVVMEERMLFKSHVRKLCSEVFSRLRSLWPSSHVFPTKTSLLLVQALLVPLFTYCEVIYSTNLQAGDVRSIEKAFSACTRFVYGLRRYDSTRDFYCRILGCSITDYLKFRRCVLVHDLALATIPRYLYSKLKCGRSTRGQSFVLPKNATLQYNRSFFVRSISDYNHVPAVVRRKNSVKAFKNAYIDFVNGSV